MPSQKETPSSTQHLGASPTGTAQPKTSATLPAPDSRPVTTLSQVATSSQLALTETSVPPELREIQLRYKLAPTTFKTLCTIPTTPSRRHILHKACFASEFRSFPIKQAEKGFFREINDHTPIPYPLKENVSQPWHKVFLLVQIDLQRGGWPARISAAARKELHQDRGRIYILMDRVLRCLADILGHRQDGRGLNVALDVLRSVKSGVWEGNNMDLLQVEGIGPAKMSRLTQAGIKTIRQLRRLEFFHIERLLSRNPPFGHQMLHKLASFPILGLRCEIVRENDPAQASTSCDVAPLDAQREPSSGRLWICRFVLGYENDGLPAWNKRYPWTTLVVEGKDGRLVWFWRGSVKRLVDGKEIVVGLHAEPGEELKVTFSCEEVVGTLLREVLQV